MIDEQYIKSLPITTNKIEVFINKEALFSKYSVVSYYCTDKEHKNLAYEQFSDVPCLSVTGIRARWIGLRYPETRFFILTKKGDEANVVDSLRGFDFLCFKVDELDDYDIKLQNRIIASLAINSLGKRKKGKMMYNDGSLLVCDDKNFNAPKSRKELVCLKIEVNEYMNLTAKTTSFSNPSSYKDLFKHKNCVFRVGNDVGGFLWDGRSVNPIVIRTGEEYNLQELYIPKKRFSDNKNNVPYWPYSQYDYSHGKLFVIWQVKNSVNEIFKDIVEIDFCDFPVLHYDECKSGDEMLRFMQEYLRGKSIWFEDPFGNSSSRRVIEQFKTETLALTGTGIVFPTKATGKDMIIKLCEPKDEEVVQTHYAKSLYRLAHSGNVLQHITIYGNDKEDTITKASARRILIELLVKDSLISRNLPDKLVPLVHDWIFYRYKINNGTIHGASMSVDENGNINIKEYGLSQNFLGEDFESFVRNTLRFGKPEKINGGKDYLALEKGGNVYLIIDTEEIPILDVELINAAYDAVVNEGETVAMFKRKKNSQSHLYLRGYIGFHLWKSEGMDGDPNASYSYISGTNSENLQITQGTKMDKMPRARRVFPLHAEHHDIIESDIMEIAGMLKFGFGRWNELMTYPFPFKFLQEYLDDACETVFSKHWKDIIYRGDL